MELDWTTFSLQILNFLVLVWLLKRFLYKPVFAAIAERRARLDRLREEAEEMRREGTALRERYDRRLAEWEEEKAGARAHLHEELAAERARLLEELHASLERERQKLRAREQRRQQEVRRQAEETALARGARFAARLLARLAGRDLEARIVTALLEDLHALPQEQRQALRASHVKTNPTALVVSAHPLADAQRRALMDALREALEHPVACEWREDPSLLAGVRISIGPWVMGANLRDELQCFAEAAHDEQRIASA